MMINVVYRSARPGRKLIRQDSNSNTASKLELCDRTVSPSDNAYQLVRQMSFSSYHVLPPIGNINRKGNDKMEEKDNDSAETKLNRSDGIMADKLVVRERIPAEEAIPSDDQDKLVSNQNQTTCNTDRNQKNSAVQEEQLMPERRKLYRKGDIFRDSDTTTDGILMRNRFKDTSFLPSAGKERLFKVPLEPDENSAERIHLAFRTPNKGRVDRYFLPTDRIGDVVTFLQQLVCGDHEKRCMLKLSINDFPRRTLDEMNSTLSDMNIKDRTVIDVLICDDSDVT